MRERSVTGSGKCGDLRHGFRPGTASVFLAPTSDERRQTEPFADIKGSDPFRRVHFMAADADQISAERLGAKRNLQERLHRIGVQQRLTAGRPHAFGDLCDIRDSAGLIVHQHQRYEGGIRTEGVGDGFG